MALQIINAGVPPQAIAERVRAAIAASMPEAMIDVRSMGPGHFEITVTDRVFEGLSRVQQQQRVYSAITDLMAGANAPVHAIDRLECRVPRD